MNGQEAAVTPHGTREGISVLAENVVRRWRPVVLDHLWLEIAASEFVVLLARQAVVRHLAAPAGRPRPADAGTVSVREPGDRLGGRLLPWHGYGRT